MSGFVKGRGIRYNASLHVGKRLLLNFDLSDFFPTIHFGRIRGRLRARPYQLNAVIATTIARLCTLDGNLPIGAPSSPVLANIICSHLDGLLTRLAREHGCFYSRYADDITFSTNRRSFPNSLATVDHENGLAAVGALISAAVTEAGFIVNPRKTRILDKSSRQEVSGVVINQFLNVPRSFMREIRGALNAWEKHGHIASEQYFKEKYNWRSSQSFENHLRGRIQHVIHIRGSDDLVVWRLVNRFNNLPDRAHSSISYDRPKDERDRLSLAVCRVESGNDELMEYNQGSGIKLPNGNVLTNFHNIEICGTVAPIIEIYLTDNAPVPVPMRVLKHDFAKDVAILEPIDPEWKMPIAAASAELSFSECKVGDDVKVGGFPSYQLGDSCQIATGEVRAFSKIEGITYFRVSVPIVKGNSGGPVFNIDGQVVGIASRGIDTHEITNAAFNGCLELFRFEKFLQS